MAAETSQTLDRGLRALSEIARHPEGLSLAELASRLEVNRTIVYRLVSTLVAHGLVRRDARGRAYVGAGVLGLAGAVTPVLRDLAVPVLRDLAERVGATAHLTVAEGEEAVAVAVVEPSWTDFHVAYRPGSRHRVGVGAAGRAIESSTDYVHTTGELQPGASGVAAAVLGVEGLRASVGIVTLGELDLDEVGPVVVRAAADVARALSTG